MSGGYVPVFFKYEEKIYALHEVYVAAGADEAVRREENELWAMESVYASLPSMRCHLPEMKPQELFLRVLTEVVRTQYGKRDEPAEHATGVRYFRHYGFGGFGV